MKKIKLYLCLLVIFTLIISGCSKPRAKKEVINVELDEYSKELDGFLPTGDFKWIYTGFAEYMQELTILDVYETSSKKTYKTSGEVLDMSSGESSLDFSLAVNYIVTHDELIQEKIEEVMMDSEFDKLTLLRLPIEVDATWSESVISSDGDKETIQATIVEIIGKKPNRTVRVEYKNKDDSYIEKRSIQEGLGVVSFDKTMKFGSEKFEMGYSLLKYKLEKADVDVGNNANSNSNSEAENSSSNSSVDTSSTDTNSSTGMIEKEQINQMTDDEIAAKDAIINFNNSWIAYINDGKLDVYKYLVRGGKAYNVIENFKKDNMKQKFIAMDVKDIYIDGDRANINVHEEIIKLVDNNSITLVYDWVYHLKKVNGNWLIDYYEGAN